MKKYLERIANSELTAIQKFQLQIFVCVADFYEQLKKQGKRPDEKWLRSKFKESGL